MTMSRTSLKPRSLTPANILATLAVVLACSGTAWGAGKLISGAKLKPRSVPGGKLKKNTVTGTEVLESKLGVVPRASLATLATNATTLAGAAASTFISSANDVSVTTSGVGWDALPGSGAYTTTRFTNFGSTTYTRGSGNATASVSLGLDAPPQFSGHALKLTSIRYCVSSIPPDNSVSIFVTRGNGISAGSIASESVGRNAAGCYTYTLPVPAAVETDTTIAVGAGLFFLPSSGVTLGPVTATYDIA